MFSKKFIMKNILIYRHETTADFVGCYEKCLQNVLL